MWEFPQFMLLSEDLMMHILSFAADAPFEKPHQRSTLTHVLPLVSKHFLQMCQSQYMWKLSLERLSAKDPFLWEKGLLRLLPRSGEPLPQETTDRSLVEFVYNRIRARTYQEVFQRIVSTYLRFTKPVFCMNGNVRLGEPFGLHFFEPRYRILIAQAMEDFPPEARQGEPILANANGDFPTFVYAHVAPFAPTKPACLVQVRQCHIHPDGTADVMLVPVAYVWLEQLWERPNTGHLYYAQCLRMGQDATRQMENRAFRASERRQFADFLSNHHLGEEQHGIIQELLGFVLARDQYNLPGRDDGEDMETGDA